LIYKKISNLGAKHRRDVTQNWIATGPSSVFEKSFARGCPLGRPHAPWAPYAWDRDIPASSFRSHPDFYQRSDYLFFIL